MSIFIEASGKPQRPKFQEFCRRAARYAALAKTSPFLFVTLTNSAERLMLEAIAEKLLRITPPELVLACRYLTEVGEADARSVAPAGGQQRGVVIVRKLLD
ncbi:hypothetical protein BN1723_002434 [Verticillium longisporum]|uniref:Uncharacterized protein n=1 Tax=Verticillium longisporum TaxID=100787 RepID=A0A0G4L8F5_VERLO|nr:hypothetical protein BN1723_002434 [Verticillium longisporum]